MSNKVVIVGAGNVGLSYAYALVNQTTFVQELVLIDVNQEKIIGEAKDLSHGVPFGPNNIEIKAGAYSDCSDAAIVCICAGANQEVGETRLDLIAKNRVVFKEVVTNVINSGFDGIFLIATNPVDVMTYYTWQVSGFPSNKVIGSGTTLDTARLRHELSLATEISAKNIHAYVIGEHGDSEFVPWSCVTVGSQKITDFLGEEQLSVIEERVRNMAYEIIKAKGYTNYGIGMCLVRITNAILGNQNSILTVSCYDTNNKIFIGGPAVLNRNGVKQRNYLTLNEDEKTKLINSINTIINAINS